MEDDVDIYADLPSLNLEKNNQDCNCKELKKELNSLISKLENIQRIKTNLENNLSSLLKTARAEITRKDKMINDLRKRLDDVTFRRNHNYKALSTTRTLSHQHTAIRINEDSSMRSQESEAEETEPHQIQFYHEEYKSKKSQNDVNRIPTVYAERLHKRIIEDENEEKKQKELINLNETKDISKENIENDKENGSEFKYRKHLIKRMNEEDDKCSHKRMKIENNEDKTVTEVPDYNFTQYDLTDKQYETKDNLIKFKDRLDTLYSFKKEKVPFYDERRAASEYRDMKQNRDCANGWRSEPKNKSVKDYDSSNIRNGHVDSLRNSRTTSTSHTTHASERFNSDYKKNGCRYSPPRRSYSRSRSDYESSSSHRLRERSSRIYREKKYDDYKYEGRYKNDRLKRNYENEGNDRKTKYKRGDLRDKYKYSLSDTEDKECSSFHKNKKYENHKTKKESILNDKKLYENTKAATKTNLRESSSRTIVNNTVNSNSGKSIEQQKVKNEEIKCEDLSESMSAHVAKKDLEDMPEEGEILDSPEKKNNSANISESNKKEKNNIKIAVIENKNEDVFVSASIDKKSICQNEANNIEQLEATDTSTKKVEVTSRLLQENSKDCEEVIQLNSCKSDIAVDEIHNCTKDENECKSHINKDLMESITQNIEITEQMHNNDINSNKNIANKRSKDSIKLNIKTAIKIKEMIESDSNIESVTKIKEIDDSSIESAPKKKEISSSNIGSVEITDVNNFNSRDSIHKIDDELKTSTAKVVTEMESVLNYNIEDGNKNQARIETFHQISNKNDVEMCLNDHNYVQNPVNVSDLDTIQKPSLKRNIILNTILDTATSKETRTEETINAQSVGIKRTISSIVKNKKDQQSKGVLISHRRKAVILSDSNASMTVLMNTNIAKMSSVINNPNNSDAILKPRACKISRVTAKATCINNHFLHL